MIRLSREEVIGYLLNIPLLRGYSKTRDLAYIDIARKLNREKIK